MYIDLGDTKVTETMNITNEQIQFLDDLRDSGIVNMFGAGSYIQDEFGVTRHDANRILNHWMETYSERHE